MAGCADVVSDVVVDVGGAADMRATSVADLVDRPLRRRPVGPGARRRQPLRQWWPSQPRRRQPRRPGQRRRQRPGTPLTDGAVHAVWLGHDGGGVVLNAEIGHARSRDGGATWTAPVAIHAPEHSPPRTRSCLDEPMIAAGRVPGAPPGDAVRRSSKWLRGDQALLVDPKRRLLHSVWTHTVQEGEHAIARLRHATRHLSPRESGASGRDGEEPEQGPEAAGDGARSRHASRARGERRRGDTGRLQRQGLSPRRATPRSPVSTSGPHSSGRPLPGSQVLSFRLSRARRGARPAGAGGCGSCRRRGRRGSGCRRTSR